MHSAVKHAPHHVSEALPGEFSLSAFESQSGRDRVILPLRVQKPRAGFLPVWSISSATMHATLP